jgi:hypothetical protein
VVENKGWQLAGGMTMLKTKPRSRKIPVPLSVISPQMKAKVFASTPARKLPSAPTSPEDIEAFSIV